MTANGKSTQRLLHSYRIAKVCILSKEKYPTHEAEKTGGKNNVTGLEEESMQIAHGSDVDLLGGKSELNSVPENNLT